MKLFPITLFLSLAYLMPLNASELLKINAKVVNPACIKLMQPWSSENANSPIIIKSIVLDACQESNLAFKGQNPVLGDDGTVTYYEDENDVHSRFSYRYLGVLSNGRHYIYHNGTIGVYSISKEDIVIDILKNATKSVSVINKLGDSLVPCFQSSVIKNDTLVVKVKKYNPEKPSAFQCSDMIETIILK